MLFVDEMVEDEMKKKKIVDLYIAVVDDVVVVVVDNIEMKKKRWLVEMVVDGEMVLW